MQGKKHLVIYLYFSFHKLCYNFIPCWYRIIIAVLSISNVNWLLYSISHRLFLHHTKYLYLCVLGACLLAQWCQPFENFTENDISDQLDSLAADVLNNLKTTWPQHPALKADINMEGMKILIHFHFWYLVNCFQCYSKKKTMSGFHVCEMATIIPSC